MDARGDADLQIVSPHRATDRVDADPAFDGESMTTDLPTARKALSQLISTVEGDDPINYRTVHATITPPEEYRP